MADYWRQQRIDNLHAPTVAGFPVAEQDVYGDAFLYVEDELIVTVDAVSCLPGLVAPDFVEITPSDAWPVELHVRVYKYAGTDPLLGVIDTLRAQARAAAPGLGINPSKVDVAPNHVFSGEIYIYHGGPSGAPQPPASGWEASTTPTSWGVGSPFVVVLDTGLVTETPLGLAANVHHETIDTDVQHMSGSQAVGLAAEAGHGTFIASIIERMALGGVPQSSVKVLNPDGFGTETTIVAALLALTEHPAGVGVVNMSLGAYSHLDRPPLALRAAISGLPPDMVVVAAAGNNGVANRPFWPAALTRVVGVASVRDSQFGIEASAFSNSGAWVDVCTQGEDILGVYGFGTFYEDPASSKRFDGWARWSGTSFAAPIVTAEIARRALSTPGTTAAQAWRLWREQLTPAAEENPDLEMFGLHWDSRQSGIVPSQP